MQDYSNILATSKEVDILTEALALLSDLVNVDLGRDDSAKLHKEMVEVCVPKVLRKVVDEEVAALGPFLLGRRWLLDPKDTAVGVRCAVLLESGVAVDRAAVREKHAPCPQSGRT